jgi:hypothetical protein
VVITRQSCRRHPTGSRSTLDWSRDWQHDQQIEGQFSAYRSKVTELLATHKHLHSRDGGDTCSCGSAWPCRREELAAWLLDDWV